MAQYYGGQPNPGLQFYQSNYAQPVSGHATPSQASYGYSAPPQGGFGSSFTSGFTGPAGVSGRMDEQGGLRTGWLAALSAEGYDGEPPLLEELGVEFNHVARKTLAVLNPFRRIDQHLMDDSDLAGPLLFFFLFGTFLMLSGRVHFGYIYGLAVIGSLALHTILSLMAPAVDPATAAQQASYPGAPAYDPTATSVGSSSSSNQPSGTLTFTRTTSVLGYCLLPLVATSLLGIGLPMDAPLGIVLTSAAVMWSSYAASGIICSISGMNRQRFLVAYPLALFYVGFGIMGVFSSRGAGTLAKVAAAGAS
ncbi:hypothetical protein QBC35DRAFT_412895 [Podospora australis]|uniref:Protein YIP n=1 Tax=Podospora australis TaxID=1536484 RepID=A0AAN6WS26_9PEZI|nr:hypothetical protein QBC35DRAFT_412895 [Podospora australis]